MRFEGFCHVKVSGSCVEPDHAIEMMMNTMKNILLKTLSGSVLLALSACATSVTPLEKNVPLPEGKLTVSLPEGSKALAPSDLQGEKWWEINRIPELNAVIEMALSKNTDIRLAEQRLNEAGAQLGLAKTDKWPAIFGQFSQARNRASQVSNIPVFAGNVTDTSTIGIGASWELDLWGRIRELEGVAQAQFLQQGYNLKGVQLSVSATTATLYTRQRVLGLLVRLTERTLASREAAYALEKQRFNAGLSNELTLRQVESELLSVKAQLPDLREQLAQNTTALSVIVGGDTPSIPVLETEGLYINPVMIVPDEAPSELLLRRPDLVAAEQQLLAADANLSAARKAFFPTLSLTAFGGRESAKFSDLFTGPARIWSFSSTITQPIFQAGRLNDQQDIASARRNQAVVNYEAAIRNAFREVYDAVVLQREARERLQTRAAQVATLKQLVALAEKRVAAGVSSQLELLDAQRNLLGAEQAWAQAWGAQQSALLAMVRALGGGFDARKV